MLCSVRLSRLIGEWGAFRDDALHECRDSACRRPFGVRLRGSSSFYRLIFDICAAPLRMTRGVFVTRVVLLPETERPMCRSLQCYIPDRLRTLQGRNPQGAPRIPTRSPLITNFPTTSIR